MKNYSSDLDTHLLEFRSKSGTSHFSIRDAAEGILITGGIGSGKTSGSGRTLALKYLSHGFGGLVLCAKEEEVDIWKNYARITGRTNDLVIIEPGSPNYFNFLEYESSQKDSGSSITANIVDVLKTVLDASEEKAGQKTNDSFWVDAMDMLIFNTVDLISLAYGKVSIEKIYNIVLTAPKKEEMGKEKTEEQQEIEDQRAFNKAYYIAQAKILKQIDDWESGFSDESMLLMKKENAYEELLFKDCPEVRLFKMVDDFFTDSLCSISEKTRSTIDFSLNGFLFRLLKEPIFSLFCDRPSNVVPEDCLNGKIIILNLPVKKYHKVGRDSQIFFKYIWQRAMERKRAVGQDRPVFLWSDECQHFLHAYDSLYQATARSSKILTVYISQNLPNFYAFMGGEQSQYKVKSFLGTLSTKIFHANADIETNSFASALIGQDYVEKLQKGVSIGEKPSQSENTQFDLEALVRPEAFCSLKTGSKRNNHVVECILHTQGNTVSNNHNHIKLRFDQNYVSPQIFKH